jgi:hypothetical protein
MIPIANAFAESEGADRTAVLGAIRRAFEVETRTPTDEQPAGPSTSIRRGQVGSEPGISRAGEAGIPARRAVVSHEDDRHGLLHRPADLHRSSLGRMDRR